MGTSDEAPTGDVKLRDINLWYCYLGPHTPHCELYYILVNTEEHAQAIVRCGHCEGVIWSGQFDIWYAEFYCLDGVVAVHQGDQLVHRCNFEGMVEEALEQILELEGVPA